MNLPCITKDLIPQKGKMGFEQTLIKAQLNDAESTAVIHEGNIFLEDQGQLSNSVLVEYINQLVAAVQGYIALESHTVQKGLFVGIQEAKFIKPVCVGDSLTLKGMVTEQVGQVSFIQGFIDRAGERVAELVTKLYAVHDTAELDALTNNGQVVDQKNNINQGKSQPPSFIGSGMRRKLYTYLDGAKVGDDFVTFTMACREDFDAFDGHFPGNPLLPGVILLEIANLGLELWAKKPVTMKSVKKMKISGVVLPNQVIKCELKIDAQDDRRPSFTAILKGTEGREVSRFSGSFDEGREV